MTTNEVATQPVHAKLSDGGAVDIATRVDADRVVVTAWDEHGSLVGFASCDVDYVHPAAAVIEVASWARQRGIGQLLLRHLIGEASAQGIDMLTWSHPADDLAARRLAEASDAVCARRVADGRARSTVFVPAA